MKLEFFKKAEENLKAAQLLFENALYNASANRAYYAGLHAAIVALANKGFRIDKIDHGLIQAEFSNRLIKRQKTYPNNFKRYLMDMQTIRDQADYSIKDVSKKLASVQIFKSKQLIEVIKKEVLK